MSLPSTPSGRLQSLPIASTAPRVPPAPPICSASAMSTVSDNDDAPQPNHALVASLLPTIRPPKALETPDGHTKRSTAQLVIGKTLSLCLMAGILGAVYAFGELTSGTGSLKKLSFSTAKLAQWEYDAGYFSSSAQSSITTAYSGDNSQLRLLRR